MKNYLVVMEPKRRMRASLVVWMSVVTAETKKAAVEAFMELESTGGKLRGHYSYNDYLQPVAHENPLGKVFRA